MTPRRYWLYATLATGAGVAFSGYLSSVKALSGVCAFNEPCPLFLGYPACYTGFSLFFSMFAVSLTALLTRSTRNGPMVANLSISALGVLFAGRLTLVEMISNGRVPFYGMGLPTCAYGLLFFIAVLILSVMAWRRRPMNAQPPSAIGHPPLSAAR